MLYLINFQKKKNIEYEHVYPSIYLCNSLYTTCMYNILFIFICYTAQIFSIFLQILLKISHIHRIHNNVYQTVQYNIMKLLILQFSSLSDIVLYILRNYRIKIFKVNKVRQYRYIYRVVSFHNSLIINNHVNHYQIIQLKTTIWWVIVK